MATHGVEDVSDIATRLREPAPSPLAYGEREAFIMNENERHEAADEIERLIKKGEAVSTMAESYGQALEAMGREVERLKFEIERLKAECEACRAAVAEIKRLTKRGET